MLRTRNYFIGWLMAVLSLAVLMLAGCQAGKERMTPAEATKRVAAGTAVLVDVREPQEWEATGVPAPAFLLSLTDLKGARSQWKSFLSENKEKELLLICRTGNRSGQAAKLLADEGYRTTNIGGFSGWQKAGMPTRKASEPRQ